MDEPQAGKLGKEAQKRLESISAAFFMPGGVFTVISEPFIMVQITFMTVQF